MDINETFNRLKRISYSEMKALWLDEWEFVDGEGFFTKHNWTQKEFLEKYYSEISPDPNVQNEILNIRRLGSK